MIHNDNFPSDKNSIYIPRNLCFSPLDTVRLPIVLAIVSITSVFNSSSTCGTLLYSTYHSILNCLSLIVLFYMNLSHGLINNPCDFRVFEYISYHSSADSIYPYRALRSRRYSTFTPLYTHKFSLCLGFTSHIMSTNSPSIFNRINLSSGMSALRYAPGTSKFATYLPSCESMMRLMNKDYRRMVGKDESSLVMKNI